MRTLPPEKAASGHGPRSPRVRTEEDEKASVTLVSGWRSYSKLHQATATSLVIPSLVDGHPIGPAEHWSVCTLPKSGRTDGGASCSEDGWPVHWRVAQPFEGGVTYTAACPERSRRNGDGKRVKKSNGTLYWTGPGWDPLLETDLSGNATAEYVFFNGKRVARVDMPGNSPKYYFEDHLGSTDIVTNPTGGIVRARTGPRGLSGVAIGDQGPAGGELCCRQQYAAPTHSQQTRMNAAPRCITWATRHH